MREGEKERTLLRSEESNRGEFPATLFKRRRTEKKVCKSGTGAKGASWCMFINTCGYAVQYSTCYKPKLSINTIISEIARVIIGKVVKLWLLSRCVAEKKERNLQQSVRSRGNVILLGLLREEGVRESTVLYGSIL